jgi:hypothetical protein
MVETYGNDRWIDAILPALVCMRLRAHATIHDRSGTLSRWGRSLYG